MRLGVASVCDLVGYGDPISSKAETAIQTLCVTFGSACSGNIATEACAGQCEVEDDDVGERSTIIYTLR